LHITQLLKRVHIFGGQTANIDKANLLNLKIYVTICSIRTLQRVMKNDNLSRYDNTVTPQQVSDALQVRYIIKL